MRENLLKKQPTWGLRRAQGTGQKSATPATLTRVILVLLTMFLLPSTAWGQDPTITVAGITPDGNGDFIDPSTSEPIHGVTFDAQTSTLTLDNARVTGTISSSIANLNINLKGFSLFTLDNESGIAVLIDYTGDTQTTSPKVTFLADKLGASLIAIGSQIEGDHHIYITSGYNTDANPNDVWSIRQTPYNGNKEIVLVSKPYMIIHRLGDWDIDDSYLYNTNENIPKVDWLSFIPATDNTPFTLKLQQSEEDKDEGINSMISPITIQDGLSELVIDLDGNIGINTQDSYQTDIAPINSKNGGGAISTTIKFTSSTEGSLTLISTSTGLLENVTPIYDTGWSATITAPQGETDITKATEAIIAKPYDLSVAGIPVTSANAYNVLGDGKVSFTPAEGDTPATLTLNNASIFATVNNAIESGLDNLTVNLVGDQNVITYYEPYCCFKGTKSDANVTFTTGDTSPGRLDGQGKESNMFVEIVPHYQNGLNYITEGDSYMIMISEYGIKIGSKEITSANVGSNGTITGIDGIKSGTVKFTPADGTTTPATPATLTLINSTIDVSGNAIETSLASLTIDLQGTNSINVEDGYVFYGIIPESETENRGITITSSSTSPGTLTLYGNLTEHATVNINESVYGSLTIDWANGSSAVIAKGFTGLMIAETPITSDNIGEDGVISGVSGITGTVSFAAANEATGTPATLTLNGATISGNIQSSISPLTVYLKGSSTITTSENDAPFEYTGTVSTPTLTFESSDEDEGELTMNGIDTDTEIASGYSVSPVFTFYDYDTGYEGWIKGTYSDPKSLFIYKNVNYNLWISNLEGTSTIQYNKNNVSSTEYGPTYHPETRSLDITGNYTYYIKSSLPVLKLNLKSDGILPKVVFEPITGVQESGSLEIITESEEKRSITFGSNTNTQPVISGFSDVIYDGFVLLSDGAQYDKTGMQLVDATGTAMTEAVFASSIEFEKPIIESTSEDGVTSVILLNKNAYTIVTNPNVSPVESYDINFGTIKYSIEYADGSEGVTDALYSSDFTISKPATITAYVTLNGESSDPAIGKYFGAKKDAFTMAIGESLADLDWCTPSFNAETEYLICEFISESDIFNYSEANSTEAISAKASGTGTVNVKLSYNDHMVTKILNNIDGSIATLTINVGESLSSVFEGENTYGALYSETAIQVPEGMKAYVITGIDEEKGTVITSDIDFIPAGVPVLLENEGEAKAITHIPYTGSATAPTNNKLNYSNPLSPAKPSATDNWYVIYNDNFVKVTAGTEVRGGKCYLNLNGTSAGTRGFYNIGDGEGTTAIREVKSGEVKGEKLASGEWFDLQGRRLNDKPNKSGLYILNGRKVVIK